MYVSILQGGDWVGTYYYQYEVSELQLPVLDLDLDILLLEYLLVGYQ